MLKPPNPIRLLVALAALAAIAVAASGCGTSTADVVSGQDLEDVAAYVGMYAGVPGAAPPKAPGGPGAQVFASNGCGGCHTLAAAESGGTVGPNLDEVLPGQTAKMVEESIADPNAKIAKGYPANVMPANFAQTLTSKELEDLVQYLLQSTH